MQDSLFGDAGEPSGPGSKPGTPGARLRQAHRDGASQVSPAQMQTQWLHLAGQLPAAVHLGTSSWSFPGWAGLVWEADYSQATLSRHGLAAYAQHPLLRTVSLDRVFYKPLTAGEYARYARQVSPQFRFMVKAPSMVTDATVRDENGRGMQVNPLFLDPAQAVTAFVEPACEGLGQCLGALVFQLSPVPVRHLARMEEVLQQLEAMLVAARQALAHTPDAILAVEVRNAEFLTPAFAQVLRRAGATYCLGLHARMPPIEEQLPLLRALWPSPLVCRWSLNRRHGAFGYEEARSSYEPFDRIVDADEPTRQTLARVAAATALAGLPVYVAINNKAEGSAPLSVFALADEIARRVASAAAASGPAG